MKPYYEEDGITLYNARCEDVLPQLNVKADLCLTDPPYGVINEDWDDLPDQALAVFTMGWICSVYHKTDALLCFAPSTRNDIETVCRMSFSNFRRLVWDKGSSATGDDGLWYVYEEMYYCHNRVRTETVQPKNLTVANLIRGARESMGLSRGGVDMVIRGKKTGLCYRWEESACLPTPTQVEQLKELLQMDGVFQKAIDEAYAEKAIVAENTSKVASDRGAILGDVFREPSPTNKQHPCEKPVKLIADLLRVYSATGDLILDPFAGSCTTGVAAKKLKRRCVLIEQSEKYCEIGAKRLSSPIPLFDKPEQLSLVGS